MKREFKNIWHPTVYPNSSAYKNNLVWRNAICNTKLFVYKEKKEMRKGEREEEVKEAGKKESKEGRKWKQRKRERKQKRKRKRREKEALEKFLKVWKWSLFKHISKVLLISFTESAINKLLAHWKICSWN